MQQVMVFFMNACADFLALDPVKTFHKFFLRLGAQTLVGHHEKNVILLVDVIQQKLDITSGVFRKDFRGGGISFCH